MKLFHIIGIVVIAIAIAMIVTTTGDASKYVTFKEAYTMARSGNDTKIHVVGTLKKNETGQIAGMNYNPTQNPNYFSFILKDANNQEQEVVYHNPMPQGFERSEQVVVVGKMQGDTFVASMILTKCPSKYQENEIKM
ncbi:MAG: cytochrome c maturation protein CcmE [Microscillaceae bacterium]|nr:cytochrome c maturation protein CcmE [Microscillaceae bacterium]